MSLDVRPGPARRPPGERVGDRTATSAYVTVRTGRIARARARARITALLGGAIVAVFAVSLMVGHTVYPPEDVIRVLLGERVPGASFTVGELRLPRALLALLAGGAFGIAGVTFQTMLRNPLASPDIIGISSGAGAAAVIGITVLHLDQSVVSLLAVVAGLATALLIHVLALKDGVAGTRLVLIGIGLSSMLHAITSAVLSKAAAWDLQTAMRWLTGSVNDASWSTITPLAVAVLVGVPVLLVQAHGLRLTQLGDDSAAALGVRVERTRFVALVTAVGLIAFATAATGPIAFVAFLSGPIAARLVRTGGSLMMPAACVGALLVLTTDLLGQWAFDTRYPVGVVTGALGAPFLIHLLVRTTRSGGSL